MGDSRDGRVARIVLEVIVDDPGVVTQLRVETRDWQYRLLTRAQLSPLTHGGVEASQASAIALWVTLLEDRLGELSGAG